MREKLGGKRIFIHHEGALGDVLLSLPCIRQIKGTASSLHVAARKNIAELLLSGGLADDISSSDSVQYSSLFTEVPDEALRIFLSSFDRAFIFTVKTSSRLVEAVRHAIGDTKVIVTIPAEEDKMHVAVFRLRQCGFRSEDTAEVEMLRMPEEHQLWAQDFLREIGFCSGRDKLICLHPGSGGKRKCWPLSDYEALIKMMAGDLRYFLLLLSGPAEDAETVRKLSDLASKNERIMHLHGEMLIRVAALLLRSDFYIGNDSGISHLAGVMKSRGAVLFGPTDPAVWRPFGETLEVFRFDPEAPSTTVTPEILFIRLKVI